MDYFSSSRQAKKAEMKVQLSSHFCFSHCFLTHLFCVIPTGVHLGDVSHSPGLILSVTKIPDVDNNISII